MRAWLCNRFKWTLEYVDALDFAEAYDLFDMMMSMDKAIIDNQKKALKGAGKRR